MTALEVLVDEAAAALPLDPIEFRRRNALKPGGRTITANPYYVSVRTPEILDKLEKHPIWRQRAEEKARAQNADLSSGPASRVSLKTTAAAPTAPSDRWKSIPTGEYRFIAITSPGVASRAARNDMERKTLGEICNQIKDPSRNGGRSLGDLVHHIGMHTLVGWAWAPGFGRHLAPGTQKEAGAGRSLGRTGAACPR